MKLMVSMETIKLTEFGIFTWFNSWLLGDNMQINFDSKLIFSDTELNMQLKCVSIAYLVTSDNVINVEIPVNIG